MSLRDDFVFSAKSLQDYADCPRRFQLRYLEGWSAPTMTTLETEQELEFERRLRQGKTLHDLAKVALGGVPAEALRRARLDGELATWLRQLLDAGMRGLPVTRRPETRLYTSLRGMRLLAQFDLLAYERGGDFVIIDWKTGGRVPPRDELRLRWQTIVYLYVAAKAGTRLYGGALPPERLRLEYVYLAKGGQRVRFDYSAQEMRADEERLSAIMAEIQAGGAFPQTEETRHCRFCPFRVHCERGEAGELQDIDMDGMDYEEDDAELDFEQIGEYAF